MVTTSERREQLLLGHRLGALLAGALGGEVLAPGDDRHPEHPAELRDLSAEAAEADHAERLAGKVEAEPAPLPAALAHPPLVGGEVAGGGQDQRPGVLGRGPGQPFGAAYRDPALDRRLEVDRGVARTRGDQQAKLGQALEQGAREGRPLAHDADDLEVPQRRRDRVQPAEMMIEDGDLDRVPERRPVGHLEGDPVVVVEDGELHLGPLPLAVAAGVSLRAPATARPRADRAGSRRWPDSRSATPRVLDRSEHRPAAAP